MRAWILPLLVLLSCRSTISPPRPAPVEPSIEQRIAEARALPLPAGNYRVDVERLWLSEEDSWAIAALLSYADDDIAISVGAPAVSPGLRVAVGNDRFRAGLSATMSRTENSERNQMFLLTLPGSAASLHVGENRFMVPFTIGHLRGGLLIPEGQFIGASLDVMLQPAGPGRVQIALTPVFSRLGTGGETVVLTEATTTLIVPLSQPLLIASSESSHDDVATALLSRTSSQGSERGVIVLTVSGG